MKAKKTKRSHPKPSQTPQVKHSQPKPTEPNIKTKKHSLLGYAWLSIAAALITIALKAGAYWLTGSVGLLSDAIESLVNLVAAIMALLMLSLAEQPADAKHPFGHGKAEYFSSGFEGVLILIAAASIGVTAVQRLLAPRMLEQVGLGLGISVLASLVNLIVALILLRAAKKYHSITLEADGHHLLTDVWTSVGVVAGVAGVVFTGKAWLDPVIAILVALNITWAGVKIIIKSVSGLMDISLPEDDQAKIIRVLDSYLQHGMQYHALRTRQAGVQQYVSLHVLVPGDWTVLAGHQLLERLEHDLRQALPRAIIFTHLEPLEDPASWDEDCELTKPVLIN